MLVELEGDNLYFQDDSCTGEIVMLAMLQDGYSSLLRTNRSVFFLAFVLALLFPGLTSCGSRNSSTSPTPTSSPPAPSTITVFLSPHLTAVTTSQSQLFTATMSGGSATLTWFVDGIQGGSASAGTIVSTGAATALYSPNASTIPGSHKVTAKLSSGNISPPAAAVVTDLAGVFTYHNDNARTGQNTKEFALTPAIVSRATFGKLFSCSLDSPGYVYAQPLYVANLTMNDGDKHNVIFVATESDWVYAFDADSGSCQQLWKKSLLAAGETTVPAADTLEMELMPEIGITSTPVIDVNSGIIYVCAKTKDSSANYHHRLHAIDITSGAEPIKPVEITARNFVPLFHLQRPALLLNNGTVYLAFGSHGDYNTYQGWIMGYDPASLSQKFVWSSTSPRNQGAIWQSGNGVASDSSGNIYVETANGAFDANRGGSNYSNSVVKLTATGGVLDFFTPLNQSTLNANDIDLGSSGVIILPDSLGSTAHPHLLLATGKTGTLYLLDQANLGKFNSSGNQDIQEVSVKPNTTQIHAGFFGQPAHWNGNLYTAAIGDFLKQFAIANGAISVPAQSRSSNTYDLRGATPAVSASGTTGGIVWAVDVSAYPSGPAVLNAYDATNVSTRIYHSPSSGTDAAGKSVKFTVPTVANGKVYVGTQGELDVYGLLPDRRSVLPGWLWGAIPFSLVALVAISILTAVALRITLLLKRRRMRQVQS